MTGTATDPDTGETQDHAWNLVKCDGKYSYVDTTWADPVWTGEGTQMETIVYDYLCCPQEQLFLTHIPEESVVLPVCDAYEQEYYRKNNRFYENYEKQQICQVLREDVEGQKSESALKFGSADAFWSGRSEDPRGNSSGNGAVSWRIVWSFYRRVVFIGKRVHFKK